MNASNIKLRTQPQQNLGDGYLQFELNQNTAAVLLVNFIQEVVVLPLGSITSIPNTSESILGLMSWRNRIIWVVDLPKILGFESQLYGMRQCNIIVISHQKETIGLMVPQIRGTVRFNSAAIQSSNNQDNHIVPYLSGCIQHEDELNLILNIQAILKSSFLHVK
ncbi:MAG: purine-binding chemotaxis protein CheW [Rivularia sp. (in: Bacteria)]|nr:purine-binding chemotaxis protein CheW [Rivularia sp. MS3]